MQSKQKETTNLMIASFYLLNLFYKTFTTLVAPSLLPLASIT
jgi:hypothetical protein